MTDRTTVFYSGAAMEPIGIHRSDATARFVARGAVARAGHDVPDAFAGHLGDHVWGIVVEVAAVPGSVPPTQSSRDRSFEVTLDDGRVVSASLAEPLLAGDPVVVLANARYWELPPAHVAALAAALNVVEEA